MVAMGQAKRISTILLMAFALVTVKGRSTRPIWDIPFHLNRNYGLTAMNSDLDFPMDITKPENDVLFSVPAQVLLREKQFPEEPFYMQLNFQPNMSLSEFYFLTIRDPDGVLRFSLSMYKRKLYRVQMKFNLLDSSEGERTIDFPFPTPLTYWRLGVLIKETSVQFYTDCPRVQTSAFHEEEGIKLLGQPLFRDGASAYLLNNGLHTKPTYFEGVLTEFSMHAGPDVKSTSCKSTEPEEGSGEPTYTFDPDFGNVIVTLPEDDESLKIPLPKLPELSTVEITTETTRPDLQDFVPYIDLSSMVVRVVDKIENRLILGSRVENGYLYMENETTILLQDIPHIFPTESSDTNAILSVDLESETTNLVDTITGELIMSRKSSEGIPLKFIKENTTGVLFEILLHNAAIHVDTYNGHFTIQDMQTGEVNLVQEMRDDVIYLENGESLRIPTSGFKTLNAIDLQTGMLQSFDILTGKRNMSEMNRDNSQMGLEEENVGSTFTATTTVITTESTMTPVATYSYNVTEIGQNETKSTSPEDNTQNCVITTRVWTTDMGMSSTYEEVDLHITGTTESIVNQNVTGVTDTDYSIIDSTVSPVELEELNSLDPEQVDLFTETIDTEIVNDSTTTSSSHPDSTKDDHTTEDVVDEYHFASNQTSTLETEFTFGTNATEIEQSTTISPVICSTRMEQLSKNKSAQEILQPDCACLDKLLTPELVDALRQNKTKAHISEDVWNEELFKSTIFLKVIKDVLDEYFSRPGVLERFQPTCSCPASANVSGCMCSKSTTTTPSPAITPSSASGQILEALKKLSYGVIILDDEPALSKIAHSLEIGSMAYLKLEDKFYLKVENTNNTWRIVNLNAQSEPIMFTEPPKVTTTPAAPIEISASLIGKSLILVAQNDPLNGQLRAGAKLSSGHSGAIFSCQRTAKKYNLSHVFYPLMSTDMFNMDYVVPPMYRHDLPIVNTRGEKLFDNFKQLINGNQAPAAPILTFSGNSIEVNPMIPCAWVGAKPVYRDGDYEFAARSKCRNWQTYDATERGLAVRIPMKPEATGFLDPSNLYEESCIKRCNVMCIQISPY